MSEDGVDLETKCSLHKLLNAALVGFLCVCVIIVFCFLTPHTSKPSERHGSCNFWPILGLKTKMYLFQCYPPSCSFFFLRYLTFSILSSLLLLSHVIFISPLFFPLPLSSILWLLFHFHFFNRVNLPWKSKYCPLVYVLF